MSNFEPFLYNNSEINLMMLIATSHPSDRDSVPGVVDHATLVILDELTSLATTTWQIVDTGICE